MTDYCLGVGRRRTWFLILSAALAMRGGASIVACGAEPAASQPNATQPAATQPAATQPAATQPAASQPAEPLDVVLARAAEWVTRPAREEIIPAYAPAADIRYRVYANPRPLRVWLASIDLTFPGVRLTTTEPTPLPPEEGDPRETRCATTPEFARQRGVQLAVNASAFRPFRKRMGETMDVVGLGVDRGTPYSSAEERNGALYISTNGRVALRGPALTTDEAWTVLPGFRMLVDDGEVAVMPREHATKFGGVNPRTALGVNRAGDSLTLLIVDGRQPGVSEGITLAELAALCRSLGLWDALNLDGGGSTTFVLEDAEHTFSVINTPAGQGAKLRQVATNLGVYLPGVGVPATGGRATLRDALIRLAAARRGGGYRWAGDGVSQDIRYAGQTVLRRSTEGSFCCAATLEVFLEAWCRTQRGVALSAVEGTWFQDWPLEKFRALHRGWWGMEEATTDPQLPAELHADIRERQVGLVLPWTGLAEAVTDYRQLQRGDFVQFWRKKGSGHSVIFWALDRDESGQERLWYWSCQGQPRYAYPATAGGEPQLMPGFGLNWEYVGEEIDPQRIYGARLLDAAPAQE